MKTSAKSWMLMAVVGLLGIAGGYSKAVAKDAKKATVTVESCSEDAAAKKDGDACKKCCKQAKAAGFNWHTDTCSCVVL